MRRAASIARGPSCIRDGDELSVVPRRLPVRSRTARGEAAGSSTSFGGPAPNRRGTCTFTVALSRLSTTGIGVPAGLVPYISANAPP